MRILFFIGMVFVGLITGVQKVYLAATESSATEISYEQLLKGGVEKAWVKVSGAKFSVMDTFFIEGFTKIKKLYIPLSPRENEKIKYFLVTDDEELLEKFNAIEKLEDESKALGQMVKLYGIVAKHSNFTAMTDEFDDIPSNIKEQLEKESNIIEEPVFFIHNKEPDFGEGLFFIGFGFLGAFLLYNSFKGSKNDLPTVSETKEIKNASANWPTLLDENGQAPTLVELLADADPAINQQALYLTRILEPLKASYDVNAVQFPLQRDQYRLTAPAQLTTNSGEHLFLYSEANIWGEENFQTLLYWMGAFREIYPEGKVLVCSAYESEYVIDIENVIDHQVIT